MVSIGTEDVDESPEEVYCFDELRLSIAQSRTNGNGEGVVDTTRNPVSLSSFRF